MPARLASKTRHQYWEWRSDVHANVQGKDNRIDEPDQIRIAVKRSAECPR